MFFSSTFTHDPGSQCVKVSARFRWVASLIQHWCLLSSVRVTRTLSQSRMWFSLFQWSVLADYGSPVPPFLLLLLFLRVLKLLPEDLLII